MIGTAIGISVAQTLFVLREAATPLCSIIAKPKCHFCLAVYNISQHNLKPQVFGCICKCLVKLECHFAWESIKYHNTSIVKP